MGPTPDKETSGVSVSGFIASVGGDIVGRDKVVHQHGPSGEEIRRLLREELARERGLDLGGLLHNMGFDTRWAGDGTAALAFVESDPKLALVLSDVVMPGGVSGLDLARTLRDQRPELPVILATGYSSYRPSRG